MTLKNTFLRFVFNYRLIYVYVLVLLYTFMQQYFVPSTNKNEIHESQHILQLQQIHVNHQHQAKRNILAYPASSTTALPIKKKNRKIKRRLPKQRRLPRSLSDIDIEVVASSNGEFYNLNNKTINFYSQIKQDKILEYLLNASHLDIKKNNGFFIEAGAFDGEQWSNTLHFELAHNWSGLLIEPSNENYRLLKNKRRKLAYTINSCLVSDGISDDHLTVKRYYVDAGPFGITTTNTSRYFNGDQGIYKVKCHSLNNILRKLFLMDSTIKHIDYMSLDVEGNEAEIIETFNWRKYQINFLNIEYNQNKTSYKWIKDYLLKHNYHETILDDVWFQDIYLAHESVYNKLNLTHRAVSQLMQNKLV